MPVLGVIKPGFRAFANLAKKGHIFPRRGARFAHGKLGQLLDCG